MTEETNNGLRDGRVRPTIIAGNGDTAFVDYHDLHPVNELSNTIMGAGVGAAGGGLLGAVPILINVERNVAALEKSASKFSFKGTGLIALGVVVGGAIGGVVSWLNARTHNQWSQRITAATLDKQKSTGPSV